MAVDYTFNRALAGAERSSALQRAILALVMPTHKRHFAPGDLQFLTSSTYHRAKLFESDRLRPQSCALRHPATPAECLQGPTVTTALTPPQSCALRQPAISPRFESNSPTTAPPAGWRLPARVLY